MNNKTPYLAINEPALGKKRPFVSLCALVIQIFGSYGLWALCQH